MSDHQEIPPDKIGKLVRDDVSSTSLGKTAEGTIWSPGCENPKCRICHGVPGQEVAENHKQDFPAGQKSLVSYESGHYKTINGEWKGDSVWCHFKKKDGGMVHINKDKVEYIETWPL